MQTRNATISIFRSGLLAGLLIIGVLLLGEPR